MEPVLRIENITKKFDRDTVLNGASFSLAQKEILCILGKNASAKSTLVRILSGALTPDGGNIYIEGVKRRISNIWKASRFGIFTIFEDHKLFEQLSLPENIFFGSYHSPGNHTSLGVVRNKNLVDAAASIIEQFSLPFSADTPVSSLSPAEARLVLLLRAYVHKSRVIIIDSCFSSLDDGEVELLCRVLLQLRERICQDTFVIFFKKDELSVPKSSKTSCLHISRNTFSSGFFAVSDCFTHTIKVVFPILTE